MSKMKPLLITLAVLAILAITVIAVLNHPAFGRKPSKARRQRIEASPNYREGQFQNEIPTPQFTGEQKSTFRALWDFITDSTPNKTPASPIPAVKTDIHSLPTDRDWLLWFGHSSYLFQLNGKRYLVDPLLNMEFPVTFMMQAFKGTEIYTPDDIPEIDYLIITHEHWDHLDYATLRDIRHKVKHVICPLGVGEYFDYWHYPSTAITELDWNEQYTVPNADTNSNSNSNSNPDPNSLPNGLTITCLPTRHFSNRLLERNQTLWAAFLVQDNNRQVYIGGDGGYDHRFQRLFEQYGSVDLALMENGQYSENWANIHMLPRDLEQAIYDLQAQQVITVHHDKFALAQHPWNEPDLTAQQIAEKLKNTPTTEQSNTPTTEHPNIQTFKQSNIQTKILDQPIGTPIFY